MIYLATFILCPFAWVGAWCVYKEIVHRRRYFLTGTQKLKLEEVGDQLELMKWLIEVLHEGLTVIWINKKAVNASLIAQETLEEFKRLAQKGEQHAEALYTAHYRS